MRIEKPAVKVARVLLILAIITGSALWFSHVGNAIAVSGTQQVASKHALLPFAVAVLAVLLIFIKIQHNKGIKAANDRYQSLIDNINGGVMILAHSRKIEGICPLYVSSGFVKMTGYTIVDIKTLFAGQYVGILHPQDRVPTFNTYLSQTETAKSYRLSYRIIRKDGETIWVLDTGYVVVDARSNRCGHSILTDITVIKKQEEALRVIDERFRIAIQASNATIFELDLQTKAFLHFENTESLLGISSDRLWENSKAYPEMSLEEYRNAVQTTFFHPDDADKFNKAFDAIFGGHHTSFESRIKRLDGSYVWCKLDMGVIKSDTGEPARAVAYVTDISDIKQNTEYLENQTQLDPMTRLYNKTTTATLIDQILNDEPTLLHALIMLDVDNFKGVNDTLGHAFGDAVLMDVCAKLKALFRSDDIVGRIGGDEFTVLMRNVPNENRVLKKAVEIGTAFRKTYAGEHGDYKISCSMGIVMTSDKSDRFATLSPKADAALYQAKRSGKDVFVLYRAEDAINYPITSTKVNATELQDIKTHWNIEERIFELLYESKNFDDTINMALAVIGQRYGVSRVYVFEQDQSSESTHSAYEWCNLDIPAESVLRRHSASDITVMLACFDEKGLFYCNDVRVLPDAQRQILEEQQIRSTLQMQIINDGKMGGIIGFDECGAYRVWTIAEVDTLSFLSKILSVFLLKRSAESSLVTLLDSRVLILDSLPDYICVINPETHAVEYANSKMKSLLPSVNKGAPCYSTLRGGQCGPCETCLVERILRGDLENLEIISEDCGIHLKVEALYIEWVNHKKMVLLHGKEGRKIL